MSEKNGGTTVNEYLGVRRRTFYEDEHWRQTGYGEWQRGRWLDLPRPGVEEASYREEG